MRFDSVKEAGVKEKKPCKVDEGHEVLDLETTFRAFLAVHIPKLTRTRLD